MHDERIVLADDGYWSMIHTSRFWAHLLLWPEPVAMGNHQYATSSDQQREAAEAAAKVLSKAWSGLHSATLVEL